MSAGNPVRSKNSVALAVAAVLAGASVSGAARAHAVARSSVMRALRKIGVGPRAHPSGPAHWNSSRRLRRSVDAGDLGTAGEGEGRVPVP